MKPGDKVTIKWEMTDYLKIPDYSYVGEILDTNYFGRGKYEVGKFCEDDDHTLSFHEHELELVEEQKFKVGDMVEIWKNPDANIHWNPDGKMDHLIGKKVTIEKIAKSLAGYDCIIIDEWRVSLDCLKLVEEKEDIKIQESRWYGTGAVELCLGDLTESHVCNGSVTYTTTPDLATSSFEKYYVGIDTGEFLEKSNKLTIKKMETTKSIVEFAKNLTLSKEEKLLRKAGLKDSDGDWTEESRMIVKEKRAKDFGYKNWDEMTNRVGVVTVSAIEFAQLFDKYKEELIKIATEFEKENKKK